MRAKMALPGMPVAGHMVTTPWTEENLADLVRQQFPIYYWPDARGSVEIAVEIVEAQQDPVHAELAIVTVEAPRLPSILVQTADARWS